MPQLDAFAGAHFLGIESGMPIRRGLITYLGTDVSAEDILRRYEEGHAIPRGRAEALARLNEYLRQVAELRVGNIVEISYAPDGTFALHKLADRPQTKPRNLP